MLDIFINQPDEKQRQKIYLELPISISKTKAQIQYAAKIEKEFVGNPNLYYSQPVHRKHLLQPDQTVFKYIPSGQQGENRHG